MDDRATRALDEEMKKRRDTFDADMEALWVGLEGARNVSGLLMMKLKDMRMAPSVGCLLSTVQCRLRGDPACLRPASRQRVLGPRRSIDI